MAEENKANPETGEKDEGKKKGKGTGRYIYPINEKINMQRTPEERREAARIAGKASVAARRAKKSIREIALVINEAPAQEAAREGLEKLGISTEDMTNGALIAAAVFRAAFEGDMKAVDKWERYVGEANETEESELERLIEGLMLNHGE